jgi:serine/threonine protein phosphatase PrpC
MQGWRKRMEDSHITDISKGENERFNIFGVFDGHGGKEVAEFVSNHFTEYFLQMKKLKKII